MKQKLKIKGKRKNQQKKVNMETLKYNTTQHAHNKTNIRMR